MNRVCRDQERGSSGKHDDDKRIIKRKEAFAEGGKEYVSETCM